MDKSKQIKNPPIFITGTDTNVGKTIITGLLAHYLIQNHSSKTTTLKWVESGVTTPQDIQTHNTLMQTPQDEQRLPIRTPTYLSTPASPHLAAQLDNTHINKQKLLTSLSTLQKTHETILIEGAGGILVPITDHETIIDLATITNCYTLLVVANKLGAINHSLLSLEALQLRGLSIIGFITTQTEPDTPKTILDDNPKTIESFSGISHLGDLPYTPIETPLQKTTIDTLQNHFKPIGKQVLKRLKTLNGE